MPRDRSRRIRVSDIHDLLDRHAALLLERGSRFEKTPAPSRDQVVELLSANDYEIRRDVVDFFTWGGYPDDSWRHPDLFWGLNPISLEAAIEMHQRQHGWSQEFWMSEGYTVNEALWFPPGPPFFLPIAVRDGREYLSIDCRSATGAEAAKEGEAGKKGEAGALWIQYSSDPEVSFLFESLGEAIEAATWCVASGLWTVDADSFITTDRPFAARTQDRDSPPFSNDGLPPKITFTVRPLDGGRVLHHQVLRDGVPISWRDLIDTLGWDGHARLSLSAAITDAPFGEVFFETPVLTGERLDTPAEFVLVEADLRSEPDPSAFDEHLEVVGVGEVPVKTFVNLGGDATLVVPTPMSDDARRNYLRSFLRTAPKMQVHSFWAAVALAMQQRIGDSPVWVSTSGGGVPWLHLRLDDRPKYYTYRPYAST